MGSQNRSKLTNVNILPFVGNWVSHRVFNISRCTTNHKSGHMNWMQIPSFYPLRATDGLSEMIKVIISTECHYEMRLWHYRSLYYVDVPQTAQLATVDGKEMAYLVHNYASAAFHVTIHTTMCRRKDLRTVKTTKTLRLCWRKKTNFQEQMWAYEFVWPLHISH